MDSNEQDKLEDIHEDVRETRRHVEVLDERVGRIDNKTDRIDERVFGRGGIEDDVQENSQQISRLHTVGTIVVGATTTVTAKILNLIP